MLTNGSLYQSVPLPDGTWIRGLFPTDQWFERIAAQVDFNGKTVEDLGCCQFSYGIQALNKGAKSVVGFDNSEERVRQSDELIKQWNYGDRATVFKDTIETYEKIWDSSTLQSDICIWSMILHWLNNPQKHIARLKGKTNVFVYRYPQGRAEDTGWRPTLDELDAVMGCKHRHAEKLSETEAQNIMLAIYE